MDRQCTRATRTVSAEADSPYIVSRYCIHAGQVLPADAQVRGRHDGPTLPTPMLYEHMRPAIPAHAHRPNVVSRYSCHIIEKSGIATETGVGNDTPGRC